jgi:predicted metal-dependent hydrolase
MQIHLPFVHADRRIAKPGSRSANPRLHTPDCESGPSQSDSAAATHDASRSKLEPLPRDRGPSTPNPESGIPKPEYIRHPRARRYVVRVREDGSIRVTIPRWGSKREALAFVVNQRDWIRKQQRRAAEERLRPEAAALEPAVERELRNRARRELPDRLLELAARHGLRVARISIRSQRWRWGSCSPHGHICLNWRLMLMPPSVRDYVLIHELMHLKRLDHSQKFWKLVARACPDYVSARQWLRAHHGILSPQ